MTLVAVSGRCHICQRFDLLEFLLWAEHWVCIECRDQFCSSGLEHTRDMLKGAELDCCGPVARVA